ncbi:DNA-binding protein [Peptoniphilus sp. MSJ-1]|uniref:DNA-binding protein n=1 Tax=Peptoniphilus ovalis TaxID=2841503 RepID=A0ABS6FHU4_9FIRM|nr:DNA-binding protein [Peptoniphilus ovalis]MBU5669574.1 DNA-binding protein [Peptoniphilus ovalis]
MGVRFYTPKELASEEDFPLGEHKLRTLANRYKNFPHLRNGNRLLLIRSEVENWLVECNKLGIKL